MLRLTLITIISTIEPLFRARGFGALALQLLLTYATSPNSPPPLPVAPTALVSRIGERNVKSQRLFEKLGFVVTKRVEVFQEIELRFRGNSEEWAQGSVEPYANSKYH